MLYCTMLCGEKKGIISKEIKTVLKQGAIKFLRTVLHNIKQQLVFANASAQVSFAKIKKVKNPLTNSYQRDNIRNSELKGGVTDTPFLLRRDSLKRNDYAKTQSHKF